MRRIIKIGFPIVCLAIIAGTFVLLNKTAEKINRNKLVEEDESFNEVLNETEQLPDENIVNETANENVVTTTDPEEIKVLEAKNRAQAIELVKRLAPPMSNVYYTNEGTENGLYIVAIRDNDTKNPNIIYSVDIENEKLEIYVK